MLRDSAALILKGHGKSLGAKKAMERSKECNMAHHHPGNSLTSEYCISCNIEKLHYSALRLLKLQS